MTYLDDIEELHGRNYSIYDDVKAEQMALEELHERSYHILNEEETVNLLVEYYEEFDRVAHGVSFYSLQMMNKAQDLFQEHSQTLENKEKQQKSENSLEPLIALSEKRRKNLIGEIVLMVAQHIEKHSVPNVFYIKKEREFSRRCNAVGKYDPLADVFILQKGSLLALEVTSSYRYSSSEIQRRMFIQKNCIKQVNGFYLKKDCICKSPSQAASYVLGRNADGKEEWADAVGRTFGDIYKTTSKKV